MDDYGDADPLSVTSYSDYGDDSGMGDAGTSYQSTTTGTSYVDQNGDASMVGDNNSLPLVSTSTPAKGASVTQLLGSSASTARDVGTAVGTLERQISQIGPSFNAAKNAAASNNSLSTWWQYASTTDKLIVGLGALAIVVALYQGKS